MSSVMLMLTFVLLLFCNVLNAYGFVIRGTYNITFKDNVDHKIDMILDEDDYEMIDKDQLKDFNVDKKLFESLDKMASLEYKKITLKTNKVDFSNETSTLPTRVKRLAKKSNVIVKPTLKKMVRKDKAENKTTMAPILAHHSTSSTKKKETSKTNEMVYNYKELLNEYYEQADSDSSFEIENTLETPDYGIMNSFKKIFLPSQDNKNFNNKSIGFQAIKSLVDDYRKQRRPTIDIIRRLSRIIKIWFLVYLIFALPLWCTRGWCCCCLFCKFFKPYPTIVTAKKYLISNPPGVFKTKNGEVHYDPTDREKEAYEEFDHFLKTN